MNDITYISFAETNLDDPGNVTMFWDVTNGNNVLKSLTKSNITKYNLFGYFGYAAAGLIDARIPKNTSFVQWDTHQVDIHPKTIRIAMGFDPRSENLYQCVFDQDGAMSEVEILKTDSSVYVVPHFQSLAEQFWFFPLVMSNLTTFLEVQQDKTNNQPEVDLPKTTRKYTRKQPTEGA